MATFLRTNYLWFLLFGSLVGLNESLIGSLNIPYRSVVLSTITITLLSLARYYIPKAGSSLVIIAIALLFKMNSMGIHNCTAHSLLCGPIAILFLGIGYELFASLIFRNNPPNYLKNILTCALTSAFAFSLFAILQTYILSIWDSSRLVTYIFVRGSLTMATSGLLSILALYPASIFKNVSFPRINPFATQGIILCMIIVLWFLG